MKLRVMGGIAGTVVALVLIAHGQARAGCSDGACGRVDWTEITADELGVPSAAKLHGRYAWEASSDGWSSHPLGGALAGYLWVSCPPSSDPSYPACAQRLMGMLATVGTDAQVGMSGGFYDAAAQMPKRPLGLFSEDDAAASPVPLLDARANVGAAALNPQVCPAALALAPNVGGGAGLGGAGASPDPGSGAGGAGPSSDPGSGAGGIGPSPEPGSGAGGGSTLSGDRSGCAVAGMQAPEGPLALGAVACVGAALMLSRRRRARG